MMAGRSSTTARDHPISSSRGTTASYLRARPRGCWADKRGAGGMGARHRASEMLEPAMVGFFSAPNSAEDWLVPQTPRRKFSGR